MRSEVAVLAVLGGVVIGSTWWPSASSPATRPPAKPPPPLLWADDFNGPAGMPPDPSKWTLRQGGAWAGGVELQAYTKRPENVAYDGQGHLRIVATRESFTGEDGIGREFTSARLDTAGRFSFHHGRIEARIKLPGGRGLLPAFWLLGDRTYELGWPAAGEIDVVEVPGHTPRVAHGSLHVPSRSVRGVRRLGRTYRARRALSRGFHRYAIVWRDGRIDFLIDGRRYGTVRRSQLRRGDQWVFEQPFHLVLSLAVGNPWTGPPDATTPFPAVMLVDWIRVHAR